MHTEKCFWTDVSEIEKFTCDFKNNKFSILFKSLDLYNMPDRYLLTVSNWKSAELFMDDFKDSLVTKGLLSEMGIIQVLHGMCFNADGSQLRLEGMMKNWFSIILEAPTIELFRLMDGCEIKVLNFDEFFVGQDVPYKQIIPIFKKNT